MFKNYRVGIDLGKTEGNANMVIVADFKDEDSYKLYANHPDHIRIVNDQIKPFIKQGGRAACQFIS